MKEYGEYTLVGYSDDNYQKKKEELRFVKLIYKDKKGNLVRGILADDNKTIQFLMWGKTYYPISNIQRKLLWGDEYIAGYILENELRVGTKEEIRQKFAELREMKSVSPGELYDVGRFLGDAEQIVAGIKGLIEERKDQKLSYKNFYVPQECREEVEKAFK